MRGLSLVRKTRLISYRPVHSRTMTRVAAPENLEIHLTEVEDKICTLLDGCTQWMHQQTGTSTSCRIAGGWVRDKLLGMQSNDIDVALTDMMGLAFAEHFQSYCNSLEEGSIEKIAKVEKNPDRSKHLETAKARVLGVEIDFVNLRSEEYAEDSRVPTEVRFGTPLEDALRRDITINALFYNVHSRAVEDYTSKGLEDLRNGIVRTPLPPRETFMDDPLRVIRCVRFASRFGFELVSELRDAARDGQIQSALRTKISRERVGEELDKMMKAANPVLSLRLIEDLALYSSIFYLPDSLVAALSAEPLHSGVGLAAASVLDILLDTSRASDTSLPPLHPRLANALQNESASRPRLYLACALTPYRGIHYTDSKGKMHPATEAILRESLKLGVQNHYIDGIPALFASANLLKNPCTGGERERVRIGLLLRDKNVHSANTGSRWTLSLLFSLVQELTHAWDYQRNALSDDQLRNCIEAYNTFVSRVEELGLHEAVDAKSILDGRDVVRILDAGKPGPWTGKILSNVIEWQLEHADGTKSDCEEWLKSEHAAGRISFDVGSTVKSSQPKRGRAEREINPLKKPKT